MPRRRPLQTRAEAAFDSASAKADEAAYSSRESIWQMAELMAHQATEQSELLQQQRETLKAAQDAAKAAQGAARAAQSSSVAAQRDANRAGRTSAELEGRIQPKARAAGRKVAPPVPSREPSPWDELMESEAAETGPDSEFWNQAPHPAEENMLAGEDDEDAPLVSKLWSRIRSKNGVE